MNLCIVKQIWRFNRRTACTNLLALVTPCFECVKCVILFNFGTRFIMCLVIVNVFVLLSVFVLKLNLNRGFEGN